MKEREQTRIRVKAYRERHKVDLSKARDVAYALMRLRKIESRRNDDPIFLMRGLGWVLSDFLTEGERKALVRELTGKGPRTAREICNGLPRKQRITLAELKKK